MIRSCRFRWGPRQTRTGSLQPATLARLSLRIRPRLFGHDTAPTTPVTPDRFRDPEFRHHAERVIQQACPAHLMPTVYWVDRTTSRQLRASAASFDTFEQRYFAWLDTVLIPGAPAATVDAARAAMVEALNAIANDTP